MTRRPDWERLGIVQQGDAQWIHPIVFVWKKALTGDPNEPPNYRACLDLRSLNKEIVVETYPPFKT